MKPGSMSRAQLLERARAGCVIDGDCWLWKGAHSDDNYPLIFLKKRGTSLRRKVFEWAGRSIPQGVFIALTCTHANCLNPAHMKPVTKNASRKGQAASAGHVARVTLGKRNSPFAKLSMDKAREIRRRAGEGEKHPSIAQDYGVSASLVSQVALGRVWREPSPWQGLA